MKLFRFAHATYTLERIHAMRKSRGYVVVDTSSVYRKRISPTDVFWEV